MELVSKVQLIEKGKISVNVKENYIESSEETNQLYETFNKINIEQRYGNDEFFEGNDS